LTDQCNFCCPYCRGSNQYTKGTLTFQQAKHVVDLWSSARLKNIRFSGGEPTLCDYLPDLVAYTRENGVERIALSTNGSASSELYHNLVEMGVNDFSISLDACCSSTGDMMSGTTGMFERVIANIQLLSKMSYVTVGIVVTKDNLSELGETVHKAASLGVSDIRIISAAQWNSDDIAEFTKFFQNVEAYPILKYRVANLGQGRNVRGIEGDDTDRCPLVIDDMAIAGNYHFPCIISLREGCEPIGTLDQKTIEEIRKERMAWFMKHNTKRCAICAKNCLDVCIDYNNRVVALNSEIAKSV
jgi:MoaA/NifB/PqqE/SkfB family radical SAM enzyme